MNKIEPKKVKEPKAKKEPKKKEPKEKPAKKEEPKKEEPKKEEPKKQETVADMTPRFLLRAYFLLLNCRTFQGVSQSKVNAERVAQDKKELEFLKNKYNFSKKEDIKPEIEKHMKMTNMKLKDWTTIYTPYEQEYKCFSKGYKPLHKYLLKLVEEETATRKPAPKEEPKPAKKEEDKKEKTPEKIKEKVKIIEKITEKMKVNKEKNKKLQDKIEKMVDKVPDKFQIALIEKLADVDCSHLEVKELHGTEKERKKQFMKQALLLHPDKNPKECKEEAEKAFKKLQEMYKGEDKKKDSPKTPPQSPKYFKPKPKEEHEKELLKALEVIKIQFKKMDNARVEKRRDDARKESEILQDMQFEAQQYISTKKLRKLYDNFIDKKLVYTPMRRERPTKE
jgi:hypothetical protein